MRYFRREVEILRDLKQRVKQEYWGKKNPLANQPHSKHKLVTEEFQAHDVLKIYQSA